MVRVSRREPGRTLQRRRRLRAGLAELIYASVAVALGVLLPEVQGGFTVPGGRAVELLLALGAGTLTFIGVVYSLLFIVVQFGTTTFTPRLNLFRDAPIVWHAFGFFTGVVLYSFTASLAIGNDERVSGLVTVMAVIAIFAIIVIYRALQTSAFRSIQLAATLEAVALRGRMVIDGLYREDAPAAPAAGEQAGAHAVAGTSDRPREVRWSHRPAILQVIDVPRVLQAAEQAHAVVEMQVGIGDWIHEGDLLAVATANADAGLDHELLSALTVGNERTFEQDPMLAFRVLADIALRALSPALNDPTSAAQALDWSASLLRTLAKSDLEIERIAAEDGSVRLVLVLPSWEDYLGVALDEILELHPASVQVRRRIEALLDGLLSLEPPERQAALKARALALADQGSVVDAGLQRGPAS